MFNIRQFLADYSRDHRTPFNEELFVRDEHDIIEKLKLIILSITNNEEYDRIMGDIPINKEANRFVIKVNYFNVIEDYIKVKEILYDLEKEENRRNKRIDYNIHDYINLKDNYIILLEVNYHVEVNGTSADKSIYIDIPKTVDKYHNILSGTEYNTNYQMADASTYNNAQNKKRDPNCAFRQTFQKHNVYKKQVMKINNLLEFDATTGQLVPSDITECVNFTIDLFGNNISINKYFLAAFGLRNAMSYLMIPEMYVSLDQPKCYDSNVILFNKDNLWITVPKYFFNNSEVVQSFFYTLTQNAPKKTESLEKFFSKNYWLEMLGADYKNKSIQKGVSMLDSVMRNYDFNMREELRLPDNDKRNLLDIMRWQMYEFDALYTKDNYDMSYKKLRLASYIAGLYARQLSYNLISISKSISTLTAEKLIKNLAIPHNWVINKMTDSDQSAVIAYNNNVNDDDTYSTLKGTIKGVSGIGENKASAVPLDCKLCNASHIGKVDCDTSPAGDPGMTFMICPDFRTFGEGQYMSNFKEPCSWREIQQALIDDYRRIMSVKSVFATREELMGTTEGSQILSQLDSISTMISNLLPYTVGTNL